MTLQSSSAKEYGLLFDFEYCTNCHTCEVACQQEHQFGPGVWGIKVLEYGPQQIGEREWEWKYVPLPTALCDLCSKRTEEGRLPTCVHHCSAGIIYYGPIDELAARLKEKPTQLLYSL